MFVPKQRKGNLSVKFSFPVVLATDKKIGWLKNSAFPPSWICELDCPTVVFLRNMFEIEAVILFLKSLSDKYFPIGACALDPFIFVTYIK